jgi:hypothetical protein
MRPADLIFPQRIPLMKAHKCVICGGDAIEFKDALSVKEYGISGMCQECQDKTFVPPKDDPCDGCIGLTDPDAYCKECPI